MDFDCPLLVLPAAAQLVWQRIYCLNLLSLQPNDFCSAAAPWSTELCPSLRHSSSSTCSTWFSQSYKHSLPDQGAAALELVTLVESPRYSPQLLSWVEEKINGVCGIVAL